MSKRDKRSGDRARTERRRAQPCRSHDAFAATVEAGAAVPERISKTLILLAAPKAPEPAPAPPPPSPADTQPATAVRVERKRDVPRPAPDAKPPLAPSSLAIVHRKPAPKTEKPKASRAPSCVASYERAFRAWSSAALGGGPPESPEERPTYEVYPPPAPSSAGGPVTSSIARARLASTAGSKRALLVRFAIVCFALVLGVCTGGIVMFAQDDAATRAATAKTELVSGAAPLHLASATSTAPEQRGTINLGTGQSAMATNGAARARSSGSRAAR